MTHPPPHDTFDDDSAYFIGPFDGNVTLLSESGGNVSFNSSDFTESENAINEHIRVHIGQRTVNHNYNQRLPHARKTIRRDNKVLQAVTLPRISCYNMRSIWSKLDSLGTDVIDRNTTISFCTGIRSCRNTR